jgi:hypothetical protein
VKSRNQYPYPWYSRFWPLSRAFFRGFEIGHESGIRRGRFQMGDTAAYEDLIQ